MKNKLPTSRIQLFFDIIKHRFSLLLSIGLSILLFSIPLIILNIWYNQYISVIDANLSDETIYNMLFTALNIKNLLSIIALAILSIGLSGIYQIIRRLVWGEGIIFFSDFKKGIKENVYTFLVLSLIISLLNFFLQYLIYLNVQNSFNYKLALGIIIGIIIMIVPIILLVMNQSTIYNLKLSYRFKNGFLLSFRQFYITYPLGILNIGIVLLFYLPSPIFYLVLLIIAPLIIAPFIILINVMVNDSIIDEFINKEHFPEIYHKGFNYENNPK